MGTLFEDMFGSIDRAWECFKGSCDSLSAQEVIDRLEAISVDISAALSFLKDEMEYVKRGGTGKTYIKDGEQEWE